MVMNDKNRDDEIDRIVKPANGPTAEAGESEEKRGLFDEKRKSVIKRQNI
jgi:hypothetical protein